jgi:DNA repair exonuclease SbcCD ATPase subunit
MRLESIDVRGYRGLRGRYELGAGLTLVTGPNEAGKSTFHEALIHGLFGFSPEQRRRRAGCSEKEQRAPWTGGPFGLALRLADAGGRRVLVSWDFEADLVAVQDALTGEPVLREQPSQRHDYELGRRLSGMGREQFEQICCLYQGALEPVRSGEELKASLQRALESAPGAQSGVAGADERLRRRLQCLGVHSGSYKVLRDGALQRLGAREQELELELAQARERRDELAAMVVELDQARTRALTLATQPLGREPLPDRDASAGAEDRAPTPTADPVLARFRTRRDELIEARARASQPRWHAGWLLAAAALVLGGLLGSLTLTPALAVAALAGLGCGWLARPMPRSRPHEQLEEFGGRSFDELDREAQAEDLLRERERSAREQELARRRERGRLEELEAQMLVERLQTLAQERERGLGDPAEIEVELAQVRGGRRRAELERDAIETAREELRRAASETHRRVAPYLIEALRRELPRITRGRYGEGTVEEDLSIRLFAPESGDLVSVEQLSRGTRDQVALVQRLEIAKLLDASAGRAPLLLDDPFAHFDSSRLSLAVELIGEVSERRQVILFSEDIHVIEAVLERWPGCALIELSDPAERVEGGMRLQALAGAGGSGPVPQGPHV